MGIWNQELDLRILQRSTDSLTGSIRKQELQYYDHKKLGGGVQPASQNPYPIYDQDLRCSLPYLWPDS